MPSIARSVLEIGPAKFTHGSHTFYSKGADVTFTCRLTGSSGSVKSQGAIANHTALGGIHNSKVLKMGVTYDAVTIDTTAAQTIDFTLAPGDTTTGITTTGGYIVIIP